MEMSEALIQIADKLGIATTEIYQIMLSAQQVKGAVMLGEFLIGISILFFVLKYTWKAACEKEKTEAKDEFSCFDFSDKFMHVFFPAFFLVIILIMIFGIINDGLLKLIIPEYTALTEMISTLAAFR